MNQLFDPVGAYRETFTTGAVTTIAAATATAGFLFSKRWVHATLAYRLRAIEAEFILTTAFGAPQEVGFDAMVARAYSVSPTGATAVTTAANDGKKRTANIASVFSAAGDIRIANAGAITAGTQTLDGQAVARTSLWAAAVGAVLPWRRYDFSQLEPGGIILVNNEGIILRNTILMGATGVGKWHFTFEWEEGLLGN